jgi:hypothetical protein
MRKFSLIWFLVTALACININCEMQAQNTHGLKYSESGESIELYTDRSVYIVNEKIFFSAIYQQQISLENSILSTVIYVELISWNGAKIVQSKIPVENNTAIGVIKIPDDIESGIYYLRAYTKWMRNFSPFSYTYLPVKIVNPFTHKTQSGPKGIEIIERTYGHKVSEADKEITLSGLELTYGRRERVEIDLNVSEDLYSGKYCLSVARAGTLEPTQSSFSFISEDGKENEKKIQFFPEIRGLSLSGKVIDKVTRKPVVGDKVSLSSSLKPVYFSLATTDSAGTFLFTFPQLKGQYEFNLSSANNRNGAKELLVDSDFCNQPVSLPYIAFQLNEQERSTVEDIVRNMQLSNKFPGIESLKKSSEDIYPFYGSPTRTIYEKEFIELDNLKEFLFELVYEVFVRYKDGEPGIFVTGQSTLSSYPVLILMDNIQVSDIKELL